MHALNIFISYAHADGALLSQQLESDLKARGRNVWFDRTRLTAGGAWSLEIERGLDVSDVVLAIVSRASYASDMCRGEQLRALRKGKRVFPILAQEDADIPVYLEAKQYISFADSQRYTAALDELDSALAAGHTAALAHSFETTYVTVPRLPQDLIPGPTNSRAFTMP